MKDELREAAWKASTSEHAFDFCEGFDAALEYTNRWTYCEDALPTEAGWYLISSENGFVNRCEFDPRDGFYHYPKVIAWRPLPSPAEIKP